MARRGVPIGMQLLIGFGVFVFLMFALIGIIFIGAWVQG